MKNIITTFFCVLLILEACTPDDKNESEPSKKDKSQREYRQVTFEVEQNTLAVSNPDIKVVVPSKVWTAELAYNILYEKLNNNGDTIYFDTLFFTPKHTKNMDNNMALMPWGKPFFSKRQNNCFAISVSFRQFSSCVLPYYIDSTEMRKDWCMIFPYRIKDREKCLILYELDSIFNKEDKFLQIDPIIDPLFKPDSLYHFP